MGTSGVNSRRDFLQTGVSVAGVTFLGGTAALARTGQSGGQSRPHSEEEESRGGHAEEEISPAEDLMREHGVLTRVLVIYDETARRLDGGAQDVSLDALRRSAQLIRSFVEDYHEKLEEQYVFPRFKSAETLSTLVDTLLAQHEAGRRVTNTILNLATQTALEDDKQRRQLSIALRQFMRMYPPHLAREDTVLFPAFRGLMSASEYDALGETFEKQEQARFGTDGFGAVVDQVAAIERHVGLYDLAQFTPEL